MYATFHGIKKCECTIWPGNFKYTHSPYVSIKLIEERDSDLTIFVESLAELDMLIDNLQIARQEKTGTVKATFAQSIAQHTIRKRQRKTANAHMPSAS